MKRNGRRPVLALSIALVGALPLPQPTAATEGPPSPDRQAALRTLLHQECGSCHGLYLKGGLGPALNASALQGQTVEQIAWTILHGRPGTAMPGWSPFIDPAESHWLAGFLLHASDTAP